MDIILLILGVCLIIAGLEADKGGWQAVAAVLIGVGLIATGIAMYTEHI